jgi:hypothetical protein
MLQTPFHFTQTGGSQKYAFPVYKNRSKISLEDINELLENVAFFFPLGWNIWIGNSYV